MKGKKKRHAKREKGILKGKLRTKNEWFVEEVWGIGSGHCKRKEKKMVYVVCECENKSKAKTKTK